MNFVFSFRCLPFHILSDTACSKFDPAGLRKVMASPVTVPRVQVTQRRPCIKHLSRWDTWADQGLATVLSPLVCSEQRCLWKRQAWRSSCHLMQAGHLGNIPCICLFPAPTPPPTPFILTSLKLPISLENTNHKVFPQALVSLEPKPISQFCFLKLKYKDVTSSFPFPSNLSYVPLHLHSNWWTPFLWLNISVYVCVHVWWLLCIFNAI